MSHPPSVADLRRHCRDSTDLEAWRRLVEELCQHNANDALDACIDAVPLVGLGSARQLAEQIVSIDFRRAGLPFAALPPPPGPREPLRPPLRPRPSPISPLVAVPTDSGWIVANTAQCADMQATNAPPRSPFAWLANDEYAFADDKQIVTSDGRKLTIDRPVTGLLAVGSDLAAASSHRLGRDFFWILSTAQPTMSPNLSPSLLGDAGAWSDGLITVGDGIQGSEVRVAWRDGRWRNIMLHTAPLRAVAPFDGGVATVDRDGQVYVWKGTPPRPYADAPLTSLASTLRRKPARVLFVAESRQLWVVGLDDSHVEMAGFDGDTTSVPGIGELPYRATGDALWVVGSRDGWLWFDPRTRAMPTSLRLPMALASDHELGRVCGTEAVPHTRAWLASGRNGESPVPPELRIRVR